MSRLSQAAISHAHRRDAAKILGLRTTSPFPSTSEIKEAYRVQAKRYHPDVIEANASSGTEAKFLEIRAAYETLLRPAMSETAIKLTTPQGNSSKDELRRYHTNTSSGPIRAMTALLFGMTGWLACTLYWRERFPHQRGYSISSLWTERRKPP